MTTFPPQRYDRGQCAHQRAGSSVLQISVTNCTAKLRGYAHEARKVVCNKIQSVVQEHVTELKFYTREALPLSQLRFFRLAICSPMVARSPARRLRDGRETSGKTSGEMSRVMPAQCPGNGRSVATAMPPNVRQDDSQDNLPCARLGRAMSAPETCETTRNTSAQQRDAVRATAKATSRKRIVEIPSSAFNHDIPKL
jgi:hypothetical protein